MWGCAFIKAKFRVKVSVEKQLVVTAEVVRLICICRIDEKSEDGCVTCRCCSVGSVQLIWLCLCQIRMSKWRRSYIPSHTKLRKLDQFQLNSIIVRKSFIFWQSHIFSITSWFVYNQWPIWTFLFITMKNQFNVFCKIYLQFKKVLIYLLCSGFCWIILLYWLRTLNSGGIKEK